MNAPPLESLIPYFCIGPPKSGTTLLARILDQHPRIACIWESYILDPSEGQSLLNPDGQNWQRHGFDEALVRRWRNQWPAVPPKDSLKGKLLKPIYTPRLARAFREVASEAFADFAARTGATAVGDKWPFYINTLDIVLKAFPEGRFIYNVRDPRGLWNSAQRFKDRKRGDVLLKQLLRLDRRVAPYLNRPNFFTFRYEDLLTQPEETAKQLYAFLGEDFSPEYLNYNPDQDPYPNRWSWVPEASQAIDPGIATKWQSQMTGEEIARVNDAAGDFMRKYGYD